MPPDARRALVAVIETLSPRVPAARWVPAENLHVTVAFLGEVADDRRDEVIIAVREGAATVRAGRAHLAGLGAFPSPRRARVLWAGLEDPAGTLAAAAAAVRTRLSGLGFVLEARAFTAHVTLARLKQPSGVDLGEHDPVPAPVPVRALTLYRSILGGGLARYEVVDEAALAP